MHCEIIHCGWHSIWMILLTNKTTTLKGERALGLDCLFLIKFILLYDNPTVCCVCVCCLYFVLESVLFSTVFNLTPHFHQRHLSIMSEKTYFKSKQGSTCLIFQVQVSAAPKLGWGLKSLLPWIACSFLAPQDAFEVMGVSESCLLMWLWWVMQGSLLFTKVYKGWYWRSEFFISRWHLVFFYIKIVLFFL